MYARSPAYFVDVWTRRPIIIPLNKLEMVRYVLPGPETVAPAMCKMSLIILLRGIQFFDFIGICIEQCLGRGLNTLVEVGKRLWTLRAKRI
jgi:hypothetical protein